LPVSKPRGKAGANPIAEFFAKRKVSAQLSASEEPRTDSK
jgi:hypothetical protein